jgi:hypothetical protein
VNAACRYEARPGKVAQKTEISLSKSSRKRVCGRVLMSTLWRIFKQSGGQGRIVESLSEFGYVGHVFPLRY